MRLIALETATDVCGVALLDGARPIVELTLDRPRAHAENLVSMMHDALRYAGLEARALEAVAVSQGPGSYTGLRIGASTAKGLAAALDLPLVAVPSLEALAAAAAAVARPGDVVCPVFQARRDEVYAAAFDLADDNRLVARRETAALETGMVPEWLDLAAGARLWLVGEGAGKVAPAFDAAGQVSILRAGGTFDTPSAGWIGRLAQARLTEGRTEDVAAFEPFYLKEFVAKKPGRSIFERLPF